MSLCTPPRSRWIEGLRYGHIHHVHMFKGTLSSLKLTYPLKIDPWKFGDSYWKPSFLGGEMAVSFREGKFKHSIYRAENTATVNGASGRYQPKG